MSDTAMAKAMRELDHKSFLCKTLWKLRNSEVFTDLTIVSGSGLKIPIHKPILVMAFKLWEFDVGDIQEEDFDSILIPDSTGEELEEAVKMLYLKWDSSYLFSLFFSRKLNYSDNVYHKEQKKKKDGELSNLPKESDDDPLIDIKEEPFNEYEVIQNGDDNAMSSVANKFPEGNSVKARGRPKGKKDSGLIKKGRGRPKGKKDSSKRNTYMFECKLCDLEFEGRLAYRKHLKKLHELPDQKTNLSLKVQKPCPYCVTVLSSVYNFNIHIALVHRDMAHQHPEILFKKSCGDCEEKFYNIQDLDKHTRAVHGKNSRSWRCNFCKEPFPDKPSLRSHRLSIHKADLTLSNLSGFIKNLPCSYCEKMYKNNNELYRHITRAHTEKVSLHPEIKMKHSCKECKQQFFDKAAIVDHNAAYHGYEFKCKICESTFKSRSARSSHTEIIHKDVKHMCERCSKVCKTKPALAEHVKRVHTGGPVFKFPCSQCTKGAQTEKGLETHMENNHRGKQYLCSFCDAAFSTRMLQSHHEKSMHGEKNLSCEYCEMKFSMNHTLQRHIKNVHVKEKDRICPECGQKFFNLDTYRCHVNRHKNIRPFACEVCGQCYHTNVMLKRHMNVHSVPYKCHLCEKAFASKGILDDHVRKHAGVKVDCRFLCGHSYMDRRNRDRHERICDANGTKGLTFSQINKH